MASQDGHGPDGVGPGQARTGLWRARLWRGVLLVDAFMLGGLVNLFFVQRLLVRIMKRLLTASAQGEILNVLDHLLVHWAIWLGALLALLLVTVGVGLWRRGAQLPPPSHRRRG